MSEKENIGVRERKKRLLTILVTVSALISAVSYITFRPTRAEGMVDHKTITGTIDSISYTIATITDTAARASPLKTYYTMKIMNSASAQKVNIFKL